MIKLIKNKFIRYKAKKIVDKLIDVTVLIAEYKYEEALEELNKLIKEHKEFKLENDTKVNILKLHLFFLFGEYDNFFKKICYSFSVIDSSKNYKFEYKQYYKGFLSNLKMIIYLINGEIEKADIEKTNMLNFLEIKLPEEEFEALEYQYPIYDDNTIQDLFKNNKYYSSLSRETKVFVTNYLKNITDKLKKEV